MGFVKDNETLPAGTISTRSDGPDPYTGPASARFAAAEANEIINRIDAAHGALYDLRTHTLGLVSIRSHGGVPDNSTNCTPALIAAATAVGSGVVHFPQDSDGGGTYYFSTFFPTQFPGVTFDVDPGVTLSIPGDEIMSPDAISLKFSRPTRFYWRMYQRSYTTAASAPMTGADPAPAKALWVDDAAFDRSSYAAVQCNTSEVVARKISWNLSDVWGTDSFASTTAKAWTFTPGSADNHFHLGMRKVLPGDELMASFAVGAGDPRLAAFVRTTGGYYGVFGSVDASAASLDYASKTTGVAGTSVALTPPWKGNHSSYAPSKAVWSIRIDAWNRGAILVNGWVLATFTTAGYIHEAGLGIYPTTAADSATVQDVVVARRKKPTFGGLVAVRVFGDSRAAPRVDSWPDHLKEALEFTAGIRAWKIDNRAVAGQDSTQQLTAFNSVGVSDVDVVVIDVGTNDVQGADAVATFLSNVTSMVTQTKAAGKVPVLVNFDLWYTQGQAGIGVGQGSSNYDSGAPYRSALLRLAAEQGVKIIDSPSLVGPILANYVNSGLTPDLTASGDPAVSDNIHPTTQANRLRAREVAKAIAGALLPAAGAMALPDVALSASNGWATTTQAPYASVDAAGLVKLDGIFDIGTGARTDGTVVFTVPAPLRPRRTMRFRAYSSTLSDPLVLSVDATTGDASIYGLTAGTYFSVDSLAWSIDPRSGY